MMSTISILIITHFISDWFFQLDEWAIKKKTQFKYLLYHCIQYTMIFIPVFFFLKINFLWLIWIFLSHLLIDNYVFVNSWNKYVRRSKKTPPDFVLVTQDQILHILALIPIILL